jgi:SAM-dependent methyltransferase
MTIQLSCPTCQGALSQTENSYRCHQCLSLFPVQDGVVTFLKEGDEFYEGAYDATVNITFANEKSLKAFLYFHLYREPYLNAIRRYARPPAAILDLGCGGGTRYLAQKGTVAGLDLSFASLKKTPGFYDQAVQADALNLPFPDDTFDLVTSSFAFEHFLPAEKPALLSQIYRVLKPGGRIIFLFDCDNHNALFRWLKKEETWYQEGIVENDHHYGLQWASVNLGLIEQSGFVLLEHRGLNKTPVQYLPVYGWIKKYQSKSKLIFIATRVAAQIARYKVLWVPYHTLVNWLDLACEPFFPLDYARVLLVVAEKTR